MAEVSAQNIERSCLYSGKKKSELKVTEEGVPAVQNFDLDINDREFIVLAGPSGRHASGGLLSRRKNGGAAHGGTDRTETVCSRHCVKKRIGPHRKKTLSGRERQLPPPLTGKRF